MINWLKNLFKLNTTSTSVNNDEVSATTNTVPAEFIPEVVNVDTVATETTEKKKPAKKPAAKKPAARKTTCC